MNDDEYAKFLAAKTAHVQFGGIEAAEIHPMLFPHQRDIVRWALRKGRAAVFADTGLGKSFIALEWARHVAKRGRVLMLTPLMVARQFEREGVKFGIGVKYLRADDGESPVVVTNYEMLDHFDVTKFVGVVIDESSVLKAFDGKTRTAIIEAFAHTPYRLAATATPAPNDFTELGNHSQFLGIKTRMEMLSEYFVHDGETTQEWRLKGHAESAFWRWVATWACIIQRPSDFGYDDAGYALPPIDVREHIIPVDVEDGWKAGQLFAIDTKTLSEQRANRRATMDKRVKAAVDIALSNPGDPVVIWAELNAEQDAVASALAEYGVSIEGSQKHEEKESLHETWLAGQRYALVSKVAIFGFGVNWQHCARMVFLGASHSFEQTYQAIRRIWRFGQKRNVEVTIIRAENEGAIMANYRRKEADAARMAAEMRDFSRDAVRAEVQGHTAREWNDYNANQRMIVPPWLVSESES